MGEKDGERKEKREKGRERKGKKRREREREGELTDVLLIPFNLVVRETEWQREKVIERKKERGVFVREKGLKGESRQGKKEKREKDSPFLS